MKIPLFFSILFILLACNEKKTSPKNEIDKALYGNFNTDKVFNLLKQGTIIINDTMTNLNIPVLHLEEIKNETHFIPEKDFYNDRDGYVVREYEITLLDTLKISVLQKQCKFTQNIFAYKNKPFKVKNYFGEMFSAKTDLWVDFYLPTCYKISNSKFVIRQQPETWCGLANQFDLFQIIDLEKMEIVQFVDRDEKIQRQGASPR